MSCGRTRQPRHRYSRTHNLEVEEEAGEPIGWEMTAFSFASPGARCLSDSISSAGPEVDSWVRRNIARSCRSPGPENSATRYHGHDYPLAGFLILAMAFALAVRKNETSPYRKNPNDAIRNLRRSMSPEPPQL